MASKKAKTTISIQSAFFLVVTAVILTAVLVMAVVKSNPTDSEAARGGKRGGSTYGSCSVTPNPASVNSQITVNGSGFKASQGLTLKVQDSSGTMFRWTVANEEGNFSLVWQVYNTGTTTISVWDSLVPSKTPLTSCTVTIS